MSLYAKFYCPKFYRFLVNSLVAYFLIFDSFSQGKKNIWSYAFECTCHVKNIPCPFSLKSIHALDSLHGSLLSINYLINFIFCSVYILILRRSKNIAPVVPNVYLAAWQSDQRVLSPPDIKRQYPIKLTV